MDILVPYVNIGSFADRIFIRFFFLLNLKILTKIKLFEDRIIHKIILENYIYYFSNKSFY